MTFSSFRHFARSSAIVTLALSASLLVAPVRAQRPTAPDAQKTVPAPDPTFDTLLSDDSYKLYLEVRDVGTLLTTGGAGEIVEPIIKLADPGAEFKSLVKFLKDNSEALATSRLMVATWPARTGIPSAMAVVEFATPEDAKKFTPKLETFLPVVMPPALTPPDEPQEQPKPSPGAQSDAKKTAAQTPDPSLTVTVHPVPAASAAPKPEPQPRFVLTRAGSLIFITDSPFKFEKLHPRSSALLAEDHNFRMARDHFSSEPVFLFLNVALEDKTAPKPSPTPVISEEEQERIRMEEQARLQKQMEEAEEARKKSEGTNANEAAIVNTPTLVAEDPSPAPTPTKEQQAQTIASNQVGSMLSLLGQGEPQWPDAVGVALALENDEYVARAILIESDSAKRLTLPFIPQLMAGPSGAVDAPSVLPDDTEVFVSVSIDFAQTYDAMRKRAELEAKANAGRPKWQRYEKGVLIAEGPPREPEPDSFAEFEKKSGLRISDDVLPVLGNEIAVGMSLKTANMVNMFGIPAPPSPKSSNDDKNKQESLPVFLIRIKDREAARRLMPRVMEGLGIGTANLVAQPERRGDSEIVNYAGVISYGFVGNFLVISDSQTVRRIADASTNGATLGSNGVFRSSRHWQPRQTVGEIYVSPVLMEGYQEQLSKQAGTMDQTMRDFLMKLSPKSSAITYALSQDSLGAVHELHLPKNLILAMVAGTSAAMSAMKAGSPEMDEAVAISALHMIAAGEEQYKMTEGNYGTIDQLVEKKLLGKDVLEKYGYKFEVTTSVHGFEAVAMPAEYGKSGKRSFFIDQSGVVRGDDHGGGPATIADKPVN
jgi:DUF2950 family protein